MDHPSKLSADALRWQFDDTQLNFSTTAEVDPAEGIVGQPIAIEAMRFGIECDAPGQNIYVRGLTGTGRMTLVRSVLNELKPKPRRRLDRCYVHNFTQPDRPRLLTLPAGHGPRLRRMMREKGEFIDTRLGEVLESPASMAARQAIQEDTQRKVSEITGPLEAELKADGLALVPMQTGPVSRAVIFPMRDGEPVPPEQLRKLVNEGQVSEEEAEALLKKISEHSKRLEKVTLDVGKTFQAGKDSLQAYVEKEIGQVLERLFEPVRETFPQDAVRTFLDEVVADITENRMPGNASENLPDATDIYGVNVICSHGDCDREGPIITENNPTVTNLLGGVEPDFVAGGQVVANYKGVRAGALVRADGGFLVLDANDVLTEPGAWRLLMRALRTRSVEIVPAELGWPLTSQSLKPEPIDVEVRVILLGNGHLYYQLDQYDQDFSDLFKVLADFDDQIERSPQGVQQYAGVVAYICEMEGLPHFSAAGVAALAEHGARIAARHDKITARFGRVADITREAAFIARKAGQETVGREHVEETIRRTRYRGSLPSKRFQEMISDRTLRIETDGAVAGQINGLAVIHAGPLSYGFPARITATVGPGRAGVIDIEGAAALSGSIHTKGFHILGGLLRYILRADHPLAFSASIAFEQSYGGIDGDSASGAEFCCLVSALTGAPINQGLAMTGAIDQRGHLQAIGGVNEKVDGFFDACVSQGLTGEQGVIIPRANAGDLMLRQDVVDAVADGRFHVYAVEFIGEALEVLTGVPAGDPESGEPYPADTLYGRARQRSAEFSGMSIARKS
ncbi:AAA family ATPase [Marinihelvus fidelis]|uniref:endopeptidase La n=1 Tax=Marinihelvus fidelis TaxID=2613842 RepID=A0A5N0TB33_9GAMM|nr:ATP-binding protein [Marinihelvus fidelis]KAA9130549.1 AAA family ATPase [Marinihelvus fidelis]